MATIRLEGLRKEFDDGTVAVSDLTLSFEEGSTTCLLGPSGCGKTTLMRMIAGLETPSAGRVFFGDHDVTDRKTRERDLGMVFQYPVVYRGTSVRENLGLPLRREALSKQEKAERIDEVLSLLDLESVAGLDVSKLDNATRQKVAVARSIVRRPPIVLFDEPVTNVDIHAKLQLKQVLKELFTKLRQTVLYVTHDQTEAMTLADNIALMKDGKIEQLASPRELYTSSNSVFAGWFLGNPGMNFVKLDEQPAFVDALLGGNVPSGVVTVGFRPEDARISSERDGANSVEVRVEHISIAAGGQSLVSLKAADHPIKAKMAFDAPLDVGVGDNAWLTVNPERLRLFDLDDRVVTSADANTAALS